METIQVMFDGYILTVLKETLPLLKAGTFRHLCKEEVDSFREKARESDSAVKPIFHPVWQDEILSKMEPIYECPKCGVPFFNRSKASGDKCSLCDPPNSK